MAVIAFGDQGKTTLWEGRSRESGSARGLYGVTGWNNGWVAWGCGCTPTGGCDASSTTEDGYWISPNGTTCTKLDANRSVFQDASTWAVEEYRGELCAVGDVVESLG